MKSENQPDFVIYLVIPTFLTTIESYKKKYYYECGLEALGQKDTLGHRSLVVIISIFIAL